MDHCELIVLVKPIKDNLRGDMSPHHCLEVFVLLKTRYDHQVNIRIEVVSLENKSETNKITVCLGAVGRASEAKPQGFRWVPLKPPSNIRDPWGYTCGGHLHSYTIR